MPDRVIFENLTLGYDRHPAVHHLDGAIPGGSLTAVIGPNGAGKSTLLKGITGQLKPMEGRVRLQDCGRADIAYLPQRAEIDSSFPMSVCDMIAMGLWRRIGPFGGLPKRLDGLLTGALAAVGLTGFADRSVDTLSGGQMQRALFARLLLQDARLILLDEPFTAVDENTAEDLCQLLHRWRDEGRTVVAVLHDIGHVRRHFPSSILLARELVAAGPTAEVATAENMFRARQLSEAFDRHAETCRRAAPEQAA